MKKQLHYYLSGFLTLILILASPVLQSTSAQTLPGAAPDFLWAESDGGDGYDGAVDLTVDVAGNVIVTGFYEGTADFGGFILNSAGGSDVYIVKYSSTGTVLWAVSAGGIGYDYAYSVISDDAGNIIVTGYFSSTAIFGTTTLNSSGGTDIFVAKYDTDGNSQWAKQGGGQNSDYGYEVTTDSQGSVVVTGTFTQFATFGQFTVESANLYGDIFVVKYDLLGNEQWVEAALNATGGTSFYNYAYGVRTDQNDNVFITGSFSNVITFGDSTLVSSYDGTDQDIYLAKYDALGNFVWVRQVYSDSSGSYSHGTDIRIDKDNNILFTGTFSVMANFEGIALNSISNADIFVAKYDQSGNALWAVQDAPSIFYNGGGEIDVDAAGNICMIATAASDQFGETDDVYFARYSGAGQKLWGQRAGLSSSSHIGGIANDSRGDMYGCGDFSDTGTFGTITLTGVSQEAFVGKLPSPKFNASPDPLDFGNVQVFSADSASLSINNTSNANLHIFNFTLVNDTSDSFGIYSGFPLDSVTALQTANMQFMFVPLYEGLKTAYMEIESDASTSPDTVFISGTGIRAQLMLSDSVLNFGSVDVGLISNLIVSVINPGISNIVIDSARIQGLDASSYSFSPQVDGDTVYFLNFLNLNVSFSPDTSGLKSAYLVLYSTASGSPDSILLNGTGLSAIQVQVPSNPGIGQPAILTITPPVSALYTIKDIFYRRTGDIVFQQDTLSSLGSNYTYDIPPEYSTISGIQYYLMFSDGSTTVTYPTLNPELNPASIDVSIPRLPYPNPIRTGEYQMVSVPLSINAPEIDSVFLDDYGSYDPKNWRIFKWQPELNDYAEYNSIVGNVSPGNSFWLINKEGRTFDVDNASSVSSFNNYTITVQPGYNQIGDPFAFPVDWLSIGNAGLLLQAPLRWNPDTQEYEMDQLVLQPWEGYWIYNPLSTIINLDVSPNTMLGKSQSPNLFAAYKNDEFMVQLKALLGSSGRQDQQNFVGMMEGAKEDLDKFDVMKPPAITDDIELLIESNRNYYARNVVPVSKDGAFWDFKVSTHNPGKAFSLAINRISAVPDNFNIWMLDRDREIPLDVDNGIVEITTPENGISSLRIIIGTEDYAKIHSENISLIPNEYALYQNYPNPFNPSTTISYQLKEKGAVTLEVFDILGRRINSLVNNTVQSPGTHSLSWDGMNSHGEKVASGIYIYQLRSKSFISSRKMILLK